MHLKYGKFHTLGTENSIAQTASFAALTRRMREEETLTFGERSVAEMFDLAVRMFLVEDQEAWSPRLSSAQVLHQAPVRHLADTSLACALLGANVERLLSEPFMLGFFFESAVTHDLRVYAQHCGARGVYHYRDAKGRDEIDAVIEAADGSWVGFEVKLGAGAVDAAAAENLLRVSSKIARPPAALAVIIPTGVSYQREDGVWVLPHTVLGA